jgi:hypothetical protein
MNLLDSFIKHRGLRGAHLYNEKEIQFYRWDEVEKASKMINVPEDAVDKLMELVANYDAKDEFVAVRVGGKGLTIEVFKANELRK